MTAIEFAKAEAVKLGRKFESNDLIGAAPELKAAVTEYVTAYSGDFAYMLEMRAAYQRNGSLTIGQAKGVLNVLRAEALREEAARKPAVVVDFTGVIALFERASKALKHPRIRLLTSAKRQVVLTVAGQTSRVPGSVNVTSEGSFSDRTWYGRVRTDGTFERSYAATDDVAEILARLSENPVEVAAEYGKLTGFCCFCGTELTDERSTDAGYGPVCAKKYGLEWGAKAA